MRITIRELREKDCSRVIPFAIRGMHFDEYTKNPLALHLYARWFVYDEMEHATQGIAAYQGKRLVGLLLARMRGESRRYHSWWRSLYVRVMTHFIRNRHSLYDRANRDMFHHYTQRVSPDGEITFLVADPQRQRQGIGRLLLQELQRREPGKWVYLYTDDNCTYSFYEHTGFQKAEERKICLHLQRKSVPLRCLLYSKQL